mmetsp:Transcript_34825/g.71089  ORF Transcript_34825/g.71089 Transcript_34825/m.71089 type:complete len:181 (-) Transcript_34825:260-802(-)
MLRSNSTNGEWMILILPYIFRDSFFHVPPALALLALRPPSSWQAVVLPSFSSFPLPTVEVSLSRQFLFLSICRIDGLSYLEPIHLFRFSTLVARARCSFVQVIFDIVALLICTTFWYSTMSTCPTHHSSPHMEIRLTIWIVQYISRRSATFLFTFCAASTMPTRRNNSAALWRFLGMFLS